MSFEASSLSSEAPLDADRARQAQRATWVSIAINVVLTVCQIAVGLFAHAQSLVADGMHTLSDLLGDFMVMFASRHGANPADERHPYGHGRYETAASMVLNAAWLLVTQVGWIWVSVVVIAGLAVVLGVLVRRLTDLGTGGAGLGERAVVDGTFGLYLGWGLTGMWLAMIIDEWLRGVLMYRRWTKRQWVQHAERARAHVVAGPEIEPSI